MFNQNIFSVYFGELVQAGTSIPAHNIHLETFYTCA